MSAPAPERLTGGSGLAPAFAAVRVRLGLVAALFALAGLGWWWTARQMGGMDEGPWTGLGSLAWFLGVWITMMAAMMFPSVAPTVALYARMTRQRSPMSAPLFVAGYLTTWTAAGLVAFGLAAVLGYFWGDVLAWERAGRWLAGAVLLVAATYELTPLKDVCLGKCRSPLGFLLGSWRDGHRGALRMGATNGAWCVGCCWALMAALFALGVMSVTWMAVVAALIAVEKTLPWRRVATYGTAALLLALGVLLLAAPDAVPALSVPGNEVPGNEVPGDEPMTEMEPMGLPRQL
jgi:predicted metal-binding membrane protein